MVGIVSGNTLGLSLGSSSTLGQRGLLGDPNVGRSGERVYVNAASGNLVLQHRDEFLASFGPEVASIRTYNSQGKFSDDNGDNWGMGVYAQQLQLVGTRNTAGSTLVRTERDGAQAIYAYDAAKLRYLSTAGSGASDRITYDSAANLYVWSEGNTRLEERYDAAGTGRLLSQRDAAGNTVSYAYNASGLLTSVTDASGETTYYDYTGSNLTQIRTVYQNNGSAVTLTRVRYAYDTSNRLASVRVDLSPDDNSVADGKTYVTTYTYDGSSKRVASIAQSDGTSQTFTYVLVGADYRIASVKDALGNTTTLSYDTANRRTTITDPLGLTTKLDYDAAGQIIKVTAPSAAGIGARTSFEYDAAGNVVRTTDGEGRTVDMAYDDRGNQTLQRDAAGNTVTRVYTPRNQLLTETTYLTPDPDGAGSATASQPLVTRYVYGTDNAGLLRFVLSPEGRVTEYRYGSRGERLSTLMFPSGTYAVGALANDAVPTEAQMTAWIPTQDLWRVQREDLTYDARGLVQKRVRQAGTDGQGNGNNDAVVSETTRYVWDQSGQLLSSLSPANVPYTYVYDGLGRLVSQNDSYTLTTTATGACDSARTARERS